MTSRIWLVVLLIFFNIAKIYPVKQSYYARGKSWPQDNTTPFPYPTNAPLEITPSLVDTSSKLRPIVNVIGAIEKVTVENNGNTVVIRLDQPITLSSLTGGPFFYTKYKFVLIYFYWNNNYRQAASDGIDGSAGPPLIAVIVFYNPKYGSPNKALLHRDGLAILGIPIYVEGHLPNPLFTFFGTVLKQIIHPGPKIPTLCGLVAAYFNYGSDPYYTYPGNYTSRGKSYDSATWVIPLANRTKISIEQFAGFQRLRNQKNSPIDATIDSFPQKPYIPVIKGSLLRQIIVP